MFNSLITKRNMLQAWPWLMPAQSPKIDADSSNIGTNGGITSGNLWSSSGQPFEGYGPGRNPFMGGRWPGKGIPMVPGSGASMGTLPMPFEGYGPPQSGHTTKLTLAGGLPQYNGVAPLQQGMQGMDARQGMSSMWRGPRKAQY